MTFAHNTLTTVLWFDHGEGQHHAPAFDVPVPQWAGIRNL
jgi:hypothetical protein